MKTPVLIVDGGSVSPALAEAAAALSLPFDLMEIDDPDLAAIYEHKLVLVRPDGHVAWRGDAGPKDPLKVIDIVRGA